MVSLSETASSLFRTALASIRADLCRRMGSSRLVGPADASANNPRPVSRRQAVQSPSGASARISAPHFLQSLLTPIIARELLAYSRLDLLRTVSQRSAAATHRSSHVLPAMLLRTRRRAG